MESARLQTLVLFDYAADRSQREVNGLILVIDFPDFKAKERFHIEGRQTFVQRSSKAVGKERREN